MTLFILTIVFTLGISALCSLLESMTLSISTVDIEEIKKASPKKGRLVEKARKEVDITISSILTINTVANTLGAILVGGLATGMFGDYWLGVVSAAMTIAILLFSEILPKNLGVQYRRTLFPIFVPALFLIRGIAHPLTSVCNFILRPFIKTNSDAVSEQEIALLAERGAREGTLAPAELGIIRQSLSLKETRITSIMTPRTNVVLLESTETAAQVLGRFRTIPAGLMPVWHDNPDNVIGVVRRRDILLAAAEGRKTATMQSLCRSPIFVAEMGTVAQAMETLLASDQRLAVVVDEFGGVAGVVTVEDIFEYILGREFKEEAREEANAPKTTRPPLNTPNEIPVA